LADDDFKYVLKFKGAGHGGLNRRIDRRVARVLKLQIPELVYANLDEAFGRTEADEEIKIYCKGAKV
jgi:ribosomal protein S24E